MQNKLLHIGFTVFTLLLLVSCNNQDKKLDPKEFILWVDDENNGLIVEKELENLVYSTEYKPSEYLTINNLENTSFTKEEFSNNLNEFKELSFFILKITSTYSDNDPLTENAKSIAEYESMVKYCSFEMSKDIKLISCQDTIECSHFHFERVYNITPYITFTLGFSQLNKLDIRMQNDCSYTIWLNDRLFGNGYILLKIDNANLMRIPQILINHDKNNS